MLLPVMVPTWAVGRDGAAPRQGQPFALQACAVDAAPLPELLVELDAVAAPLEPWDGGSSAHHPVRLHVGPAAVHYESTSPLTGPVSLRVCLQDGSTGFAHPDTPELAGTVTRLRLLSAWLRWDDERQDYARSGQHRLDLLQEWPYDHRLEPANPDGVDLEFWEPDALVVDLQL